MGNPVLWVGTTAITAVRNTIQDPSGAASRRWTDAEVASYIDRALQQIVADTETAVETSWLASLTANVRELALPPNFFKDKTVEYIKAAGDVRKLTYFTREEYDEFFSRDPSATGEPTGYWYWARKGSDPTTYQTGSIYLHPTPDATAAAANGGSNNLRIWGYKVPDSVAADTAKVIELEPPYVEAMLQYASALAKLDDGDHGAYDRMMGNYERMVRKIMDIRAQKSRSRTSTIRARDSVLTTWPRNSDLPWRRPWVG